MSTFRYIKDVLPHSSYGNSLGGALSTAAGFNEDDLGDGHVERFWQTNLGAATDFSLAIDLGTTDWDTVAVFDVRATDGTLPTAVTIDLGSSMSFWPGIDEVLTMNTRGDGWLQPTETITRYALVHVAFASAKTLRIGEIVFGKMESLTRQFTDRRDTHDNRLIENESPGGSISRAKVGAKRRVLALAWGELLETERDEIETMLGHADDGMSPLVFLPNSYDDADIIHGTVPRTWSEDISDPIWTNIGLDIVESGRAV